LYNIQNSKLMKKLLLIAAAAFIILMLGKMANAQSQRLVLFEEFTQASCGPCAATNPGLNALLQANPSKVTSIKYQTSWPGTDPMNAQNPTEVQTRVDYYSVTGVPNGEEDGNVFNDHPAYYTQDNIDNEYAVASPFTIDLSHSLYSNDDSVLITCKIKCTQALTVTGPLVCHVVLTEEQIKFATAPGTNGEKEFYNVMRKMIPSDQGTTLANTWAVNDSVVLTFAVALPTYIYNVSQVAVVAFIQDNSDKNIKQAAYSAPLPMPLDAAVTTLSNVPSMQCSATFTPTVLLKNNGTTTLTAATISYKIDNGTALTQPWTGTLAQNATELVTLPLVTSTTGSHTFTVSVSAPNGGTDQNTYNDAISKSFNISLSTPAALPLAEGFTSSTFPPANWIIINPDAGLTWVRAAAGSSAAGSAKIAFYDITGGNIDDLIIAPLDLSTATQADMTFKYAHAQYDATYIDELDILVSTDCGSTWTNVWSKVDPDLATAAATTSAYTPTTAQWVADTISLAAYLGQSKVFIKFSALSGYGNNCYVDDINILQNVGINELNTTMSSVNVYPNPFSNNANVEFSLTQPEKLSFEIYNLLGEKVYTVNEQTYSAGSHGFVIHAEELDPGVYYLNAIVEGKVYTQKLTVVK
jgi:hypothetical protein